MCDNTYVSDLVLCVLIREDNTPLQTLGQISQLNSHYHALVQPRIARALALRQKYTARFCRALWRKKLYFPALRPTHHTHIIDVATAHANAFGLILHSAKCVDNITFISGISFVCRRRVEFNFAIESDTSVFHRSRVLLHDYDNNDVAYVNMQCLPRDLGRNIANTPHLIIGVTYGENKQCDRDFIIENISHIIVNYEYIQTPTSECRQRVIPPFTYCSRLDAVTKINAGPCLRALAHAYCEKRYIPEEFVNDIIEYCRKMIAEHKLTMINEKKLYTKP